MRTLLAAVSLFALLTIRISAADVPPLLLKPDTIQPAGEQATKLMRLMTPEERLEFVGGTGMGIRGVPRLGIPALNFMDASCGLRLDESRPIRSTAFPCTLLLSATWDPELAREYAAAVAEEFRAAGIHFILGPGMNVYRTSLNGRNFEYLGEDPFLAARMVEAYVNGASGVNVATTLKHYLCNETDNHRRSANAIVDERALHEIYLPPFEAGVNAGSWGVMTSYNLVNGEWASQNKFLVTDLLRNSLGFRNLVMTDWGSTWYGDKLAKSGVDLEMGKAVALKRDRELVLGTSDIDRMVVSILRTGIASGLYELEAKGEFKRPEWIEKYPSHQQLALKVNQSGIVLLKNTGILPLKADPNDKILVAGNMAGMLELSGGGSGHVQGYDRKSYLQLVQKTFGKELVVSSDNPTDDQIRSATTVLVFTGWRNTDKNVGGGIMESEGSNHPFTLPDDALIARCTALNPRTIVSLACGGGVRMDWADKAAGIFLAFYGGQTGPEALMDLMTGKANPSGKLPISIERAEEDSPAFGEDRQLQPGKTLFEPKDLASRTKTEGYDFLHNSDQSEAYTHDIPYNEGVFVGYRWYDMKKIDARFPFGYGLSYTTFGYSDLKVDKKGDNEVVSLTVKNTGVVAGAEVVEIYVGETKSSVHRPARELKGFSKVFLKAGESRRVEVNLNSRAFAFWDQASKGWKVDPGTFVIGAGSSSRDIRLNTTITRVGKCLNEEKHP